MHRFSTSSGKMLWYDVTNNRISLWNPSKEAIAFPVIHFKEPTKIVSADKIRMFTIEMTQQCNLRCSYCCYSGLYRDRRPHNNKEISITKMELTLRRFLEPVKPMMRLRMQSMRHLRINQRSMILATLLIWIREKCHK